jgi:tripartite-type tricarboxylate transporter receptor subunit TctC
MKKTVLALAIALAGFASATAAFAQNYPNHTVRLVVPWPPGGLTDNISRLVANKLSEKWKQQVIVENRAGANGIIGAEAVAKAAPDGYTLVTGNPETHGLNKFLFAKMPYDAATDFVPISLMVTQPFILVAHPSFPGKTVAEVVSIAKAKPGQVRFASWGRGSTSHLAMERFLSGAGLTMLHVPYKGVTPAITDLIGGQVDIMLAGTSSLPHVKSGKLIGIAVSSAKRSPALPGMPTIAESGFPGFDMLTWYGMSAPRGTPPEIIKKISDDVRAALALPDMVERLNSQAVDIVASGPEEFKQFNEREIANWAQLTKAANVNPE